MPKDGWPVNFDPIGGMQSQIYNQIKSLSKLGVEQVVLTTGMPGVPKKWKIDKNTTVYAVRIPFPKIKSETSGLKCFDLLWGLGCINWFIKNKINGNHKSFDIVHSHCSGVSWPLLMGLVFSRLFNAKLVYTVHCSNLRTYVPLSRIDSVQNIFRKKLEEYALKKADKVITLTDKTSSFYLKENILSNDKVVTIPDSIDQEQFYHLGSKLNFNKICKNYKIPNCKKIVTYVGRIAIEKGWPYFIEAASMIKDENIHFVICGDGNQGEKLRQMIKSKGLDSKITVTGFVPISVISAVLQRSEMLVLPSIHEEFGSILLEAMATGTPIIATKVGGIPSILTDGETGLLIQPKSVDDLVDKIKKLSKDVKLAKKLAKNSLKLVKNKYDQEKNIKKTEEVYLKIL